MENQVTLDSWFGLAFLSGEIIPGDKDEHALSPSSPGSVYVLLSLSWESFLAFPVTTGVTKIPSSMNDFITSHDFNLTMLMVLKIIPIHIFPPSITLQMFVKIFPQHILQQLQALLVKIRTQHLSL